MDSPDFSLAALHDALDGERQSRGLTWAAAVREMSGAFVQGAARPLATRR